ncbi:hypothetical protein EMCRGX_G024880 [Ephydatia muelleri]
MGQKWRQLLHLIPIPFQLITALAEDDLVRQLHNRLVMGGRGSTNTQPLVDVRGQSVGDDRIRHWSKPSRSQNYRTLSTFVSELGEQTFKVETSPFKDDLISEAGVLFCNTL